MDRLIVLVVVLAVACAAGVVLRLRQGRFRSGTFRTYAADSASAPVSGTVLTAADLGAPLGQRATLVQFSSEVCAYCGPTRELLTDVARTQDGLAFVEIDAAARLDLAKRLHVFSTPTILVLAADGSVAGRAAGQPRRSDLLAAVGPVLAGPVLAGPVLAGPVLDGPVLGGTALGGAAGRELQSDSSAADE